MRRFRHLSFDDRLKMEVLIKAGHSKGEIAAIMGIHKSTVYREIDRGQYEHLTHTYEIETRYSADVSERKYRENLKEKGPGLKIGNDLKLADYIERKIIKEDYSPEAVVGEIKREQMNFTTSICVTTLYSYIEKGLFLSLTNKNLPVKKNQKRQYHRVRKHARAIKGESIEKRPEEINNRESFGHWEMDTVIGKRGESKKSMLVLTERKTRQEIVRILPNHTAESVVRALNSMERKWGSQFSKVFKTITVDNGTEFADCEGIEKSILKKGRRTKVYYCHPYSSYERGSNEVANKLIRRKIPKGTNFDSKTKQEIDKIEHWVNHYPRGIFDYETSEQRFNEELKRMG